MLLAEQIVAEYLRNEDIGTNPVDEGPWPIFVGRLPTTPDAVIAVHRDSVPTQGRHHGTGETIHQEGLQIRVRHKEYTEGQQKILEISLNFDTIVRKILSVGVKQYRIQSISQFSTPMFIGPDPNNRCNFVLNCLASIAELQSA
jgi:hypothetical protein